MASMDLLSNKEQTKTTKVLPIGVSDFRKIRENNYYYVDKTLLISDWLISAAEVTLITRPRRFGKTLNMSMLREFFDITKDSKELFAGLKIMDTTYAAEMNQYPVIFLSFRDCKGDKENMFNCVFRQLLNIYQLAYNLLKPDPFDQTRLNRIMDILVNEDINRSPSVNDSIYFLSKLLYQHYGKKVIILIDEYDTPMISAYENGYYEDIRFFFSSLYGSALKDNPYLERGMLTGIHRIAKESIFSGLNNLSVCTVMTEKYHQYFGLIPEETKTLLDYCNLPLNEQVKLMYGGYFFGKQEIYNPWSIMNYADIKELEPFWANTASNEILLQAILKADSLTQKNFEQLLVGEKVIASVDLQTSFFELSKPSTLWGLFLNSGYLTISERLKAGSLQAEICIPNQEVMSSFKGIIERYGGFAPDTLDALFSALLHKDFDNFKMVYDHIILTCTSFHDGSTENAYHMLFLGMSVYLTREYRIFSNVEYGHGRADIRLEAKYPNMPNFIIEFKQDKQGQDLNELAKEAVEQIHEKKYYVNLTGETVLLGIAHNLKHCCILNEIIHQ